MKLPKVYEPKEYESDVYALWEKSRAFAPQGKGETYTIAMPPPNANGNLHLGHALTIAIEDIAIRYQRLRGKRVLFIPGADHAGFETQVVYERQLEKEGKSRFDYSREELYQQIWDFVAGNRDNYEDQFRRLGASVSWEHYTFTLDQKIIERAYKTFKKMWDEGLVYRGERLVNFCTHHGTAFADIEVEYKEEQGHLWHIKYPLTDGSGEIIVATTRPETMLGDVAVAVHPEDERYAEFIGKTVKLPLTDRQIPIITDAFVDKDFGSGAVKITPAHDPNDFEVGERHDLPKITVINHEGKLINVPDDYRNLSVEEGRKQVVADLEKLGLLQATEEHLHSVGHCYKCGTTIQPLLREQWFVDMEPLAKRAIEALEQGKITFHPENRRTQLITYLKNLRDWNISRQIAWGIPIPAFQNIDEPGDWIYDERVTQELIERDGKTYRRDPDVFDTWFSSGQWPFATLGYPDSKDMQDFYPLSLMETGYDILMPWVSRMIMLGLYITDKVPFETVYLHGLVLDEQGQKMSKSKGNVINPLEVVDEYGSDALRMGIITGQSAGSNQPFTTSKVVGARNFCNKLWNIARYIEGSLGDELDLAAGPKPATIADHWILARLYTAREQIEQHMAVYGLSEAYNQLYHMIWDDVADWYVEASKEAQNASVLSYVLATVLKLAHPFAPFVTETIWQALTEDDAPLIAEQWPGAVSYDKKSAEEFEAIQNIVTEVRSIKAEINLFGGTLGYGDDTVVERNQGMIAKLAKLDNVEQGGQGIRLTSAGADCWFVMDETTAQRYSDALQAKLTDVSRQISALEGRLGNEAYVAKAPSHLVEESRTQLQDLQTQQTKLTDQLQNLS